MKDSAEIAVFGVLFGNAPYLTGLSFERLEIVAYHVFLITIAFLTYRAKKKKD